MNGCTVSIFLSSYKQINTIIQDLESQAKIILVDSLQGTGTEQEQDLGATQSVYFALAVVMGKYEMPEALLQVKI